MRKTIWGGGEGKGLIDGGSTVRALPMFVAANKWTLPIPGSISIRPVDQRANQLGRRRDTARGNYSEKRRLWKFIRLCQLGGL